MYYSSGSIGAIIGSAVGGAIARNNNHCNCCYDVAPFSWGNFLITLVVAAVAIFVIWKLGFYLIHKLEDEIKKF